MNFPSTTEESEKALSLAPTKEESGAYFMRFDREHLQTSEEMSDEDWDQFEKDIENAFEQVP